MDHDSFISLFNIFNVLNWSIAAISMHSELLGFLTVIWFFGALRFSTACLGLCYVIGWENSKDMGRNVIASFFLMSLLIILKYFEYDNTEYIKYFR